MVCIYRRAPDGSYFYRKFDFFHWGLFIAFSFNNIAIIAWLFVWTNAYVGVNKINLHRKKNFFLSY